MLTRSPELIVKKLSPSARGTVRPVAPHCHAAAVGGLGSPAASPPAGSSCPSTTTLRFPPLQPLSPWPHSLRAQSRGTVQSAFFSERLARPVLAIPDWTSTVCAASWPTITRLICNGRFHPEPPPARGRHRARTCHARGGPTTTESRKVPLGWRRRAPDAAGRGGLGGGGAAARPAPPPTEVPTAGGPGAAMPVRSS